jgi:RHS repeat-associated protein
VYDADGNRLQQAGPQGSVSYSYNAADEMVAAGAATYVYDGNGNQLTKTSGRTTVNYGWDARNRLVSVASGAGSTLYQYDGDGNRIAQQVAAGTYSYVNDTAELLPVVLNENGPDGNINYLYGNALISETSPAFQYYYHFDGLGSTSGVTDPTGAEKESYAYDPWGGIIQPTDPLGTKVKYKFVGEAYDPQSGLYFLRRRYYDTPSGRLLNTDPLPHTPSFPLGLNKYLYGLANPLRYADPSGLLPFGLDIITDLIQFYKNGQAYNSAYQAQLDACADGNCPDDAQANGLNQYLGSQVLAPAQQAAVAGEGLALSGGLAGSGVDVPSNPAQAVNDFLGIPGAIAKLKQLFFGPPASISGQPAAPTTSTATGATNGNPSPYSQPHK